jgi:ADP-heptose:LPS heptosyltransferase
VEAGERRGIGLSRFGTLFPLNAQCAFYFRLGLDNDLKFRDNRKSHQELLYAAVGLPYRGQRYRLYPGDAERRRAAALWQGWHVGADEIVVGLNTGAGRAFANKSWPPEKFARLAHRLMAQPGRRVALFGGPAEREANQRIAADCPGVLDTGCDHAELEFAALLARCNVLVTGDTMALHAAIAADVACVVLFGPTCPQEIDLYGRGEPIVTGLACAPCYRQHCDLSPNCMDDLAVERVIAAVERWCRRAPVATPTRFQGATELPVLQAVE